MTASPKPRVAVVFNDDANLLKTGDPREQVAIAGAAREAETVARALARRGFLTTTIPIRADITEAAAAIQASRSDVIFNIVEGFGGNSRLEGAVCGLFELLQIPYTGNPAAALYLCQDKQRAKAVLRDAGVPVAEGVALADAADALPKDFPWPAFVKLRYEDASHGIGWHNVCADEAALRRCAAKLIESYKQDVVVEEFLSGREFNVALLANDVLPIAELDYTALPNNYPPIVTFDAKWIEDSPDYKQTPVICPAVIDEPLRADLARIGRDAFHALGCRGYARVDIRLDRNGRPVVMEVNPNPDISPDAGFARSALRAGIEYDELVERIVRLAI
jgi:D-alanine-D-alanine ligase